MEENNLEAWHLFLDMGKLDLFLYLLPVLSKLGA